jgi:hypothetical protein
MFTRSKREEAGRPTSTPVGVDHRTPRPGSRVARSPRSSPTRPKLAPRRSAVGAITAGAPNPRSLHRLDRPSSCPAASPPSIHGSTMRTYGAAVTRWISGCAGHLEGDARCPPRGCWRHGWCSSKAAGHQPHLARPHPLRVLHLCLCDAAKNAIWRGGEERC